MEETEDALVEIPAAAPIVSKPDAGGELSRGVAQAVEAERNRTAKIIERCGAFGVAAGDYISRGLSLEQVNEELLHQLRTRRAPLVSEVEVLADETDRYRAAVSDGLLLRGGMTPQKLSDGAKDFRGMSIRDVAIDCLARSGVERAARMDSDTLMRSALSPDVAFSGVLTDTVNKSMAIEYAAAPPTYPLWTSKGSAPDFKPKKRYQISEAGDLDEIPQNGEMKMDHPTASGVTSALATFGKTFGFTRQALINDDLDVLTRLPAAYVRAAYRGINRAVYQMLTDNPVMEDGNPLFCAAHGNLGTAAKPSIAAYQEALAGMMRQRGLRGMERLNVRPAFVLSDPLQFSEHAMLLNSPAHPEQANAGTFNPFRGMMQLVMDADLVSDTVGPLPYFFAADPSGCGTIEISYLNGVEAPTLDYQIGFDFLGIKFRITHDRGVTLLDYRGLYKNEGIAG